MNKLKTKRARLHLSLVRFNKQTNKQSEKFNKIGWLAWKYQTITLMNQTQNHRNLDWNGWKPTRDAGNLLWCIYGVFKMMEGFGGEIVHRKYTVSDINGVRLETRARTSRDAEGLTLWKEDANISNVLCVTHLYYSILSVFLSEHHNYRQCRQARGQWDTGVPTKT